MAPLSKVDLQSRLSALASSHDVPLTADRDALAGRLELNLGKWFLGGRKLTYAMSCRLDEADHALVFRESATESSWGIPPPSLKVETTSQRGTKVTESRTTKSVGGGGTLDYGALRAAIESAATEAGWRFTFEAGKRP